VINGQIVVRNRLLRVEKGFEHIRHDGGRLGQIFGPQTRCRT